MLALVAAAAATLSASKPVFWQTATLNDFLRGEVENLSVDGHGRLVLGPATELVAETTSPFLWAMAVAPDGSIYVGSGNEGKVFKIDAAGKTDDVLRHDRARSARPRAGAGRHALRGDVARGAHLQDRSHRQGRAVLRSRRQIHLEPCARLAGKSLRGHRRERADLQDHARRQRQRRSTQTKATHVIALAFERNGQLLAGTEGPGRLFRVDAAGKAFLLLDSTFQEIRAIRLDPQGNIYLAALSGRTTSSEPAAGATQPRRPSTVGRARAGSDRHDRSDRDCRCR